MLDPPLIPQGRFGQGVAQASNGESSSSLCCLSFSAPRFHSWCELFHGFKTSSPELQCSRRPPSHHESAQRRPVSHGATHALLSCTKGVLQGALMFQDLQIQAPPADPFGASSTLSSCCKQHACALSKLRGQPLLSRPLDHVARAAVIPKRDARLPRQRPPCRVRQVTALAKDLAPSLPALLRLMQSDRN